MIIKANSLTKEAAVEYQIENGKQLIKKLVPEVIEKETVSEEFINQCVITSLKVHAMVKTLGPDDLIVPDWDECRDLVNDLIFDINAIRKEHPDWNANKIEECLTA